MCLPPLGLCLLPAANCEHRRGPCRHHTSIIRAALLPFLHLHSSSSQLLPPPPLPSSPPSQEFPLWWFFLAVPSQSFGPWIVGGTLWGIVVPHTIAANFGDHEKALVLASLGITHPAPSVQKREVVGRFSQRTAMGELQPFVRVLCPGTLGTIMSFAGPFIGSLSDRLPEAFPNFTRRFGRRATNLPPSSPPPWF